MYIITVRWIASAEELKLRMGWRFAGGYGTPTPASREINLITTGPLTRSLTRCNSGDPSVPAIVKREMALLKRQGIRTSKQSETLL